MIFNVWSPARVGKSEVAFDVTRANIPRAGRGDAEWIAACLAAIGVEAAARTWSVQAARCYFYSDYTDEEVWEDRWTDTWMVAVQLAGQAPADFGAPDPLPKGVDQYDRTWEHDQVDPGHDRTALLLFLFRGAEDEARRIVEPLVAGLPAGLRASVPRVEAAGPEWTRVRVVVIGQVFPQHVEALEEVIRQAREQGLLVNRNEQDAPAP
jgi:hypothetical protein